LLVFDNEKESYERFIQNLIKQNIKDFAEIDVSFEDKLDQLEEWEQEYFKNSKEYIGENLLRNIFHIARHSSSKRWRNHQDGLTLMNEKSQLR
jgi:primosomal protein N''